MPISTTTMNSLNVPPRRITLHDLPPPPPLPSLPTRAGNHPYPSPATLPQMSPPQITYFPPPPLGPGFSPPPPQLDSPVLHKVWILDCKSCGNFLTNRGMKAVLLLRPNVPLYSTDALPVNCSVYSINQPVTRRPASSPAQTYPIHDSSSARDRDEVPRTCECLTQTLSCHGCGAPVGYMIVVPCLRCTSSTFSPSAAPYPRPHWHPHIYTYPLPPLTVPVTRMRSTNGHRFVFHSSEVVAEERLYIAGEPGVIPDKSLGDHSPVCQESPSEQAHLMRDMVPQFYAQTGFVHPSHLRAHRPPTPLLQEASQTSPSPSLPEFNPQNSRIPSPVMQHIFRALPLPGESTGSSASAEAELISAPRMNDIFMQTHNVLQRMRRSHLEPSISGDGTSRSLNGGFDLLSHNGSSVPPEHPSLRMPADTMPSRDYTFHDLPAFVSPSAPPSLAFPSIQHTHMTSPSPPPKTEKLKAGDVLFWHHLIRRGELPCMHDDERARASGGAGSDRYCGNSDDDDELPGVAGAVVACAR